MVELTSVRAVKELLAAQGISPLKQLGQNFLVDAGALTKIADAAGLTQADTVLEVGPGMGALTQQFCLRCGRVVAVEIDAGLVRLLGSTLEGLDNAEVVHADFLKLDLEELALPPGFVAAGNLPYYITTPVIMKLLQARPSRMVFMMQKEVAERMEARPGTKAYGSLSIAVQRLATVKAVMKVPPECFYPRPGVDSIVLRLDGVYAERDVDEAFFERLVRAAFAMRRKTLSNNLAAIGIEKERTQQALLEMGMDASARGETLDVEAFEELSRRLR